MSRQEDPSIDGDDSDAVLDAGIDSLDTDEFVEADDIDIVAADLKPADSETGTTEPMPQKGAQSAWQRLDERREEAWLREQLEDWDDWDDDSELH